MKKRVRLEQHCSYSKRSTLILKVGIVLPVGPGKYYRDFKPPHCPHHSFWIVVSPIHGEKAHEKVKFVILTHCQAGSPSCLATEHLLCQASRTDGAGKCSWCPHSCSPEWGTDTHCRYCRARESWIFWAARGASGWNSHSPSNTRPFWWSLCLQPSCIKKKIH